MYDELISALRNNADHYGFVGENGLVHLLTNAADAIEELSKRVPKVPHGRLIDADALKIEVFAHDKLMKDGWNNMDMGMFTGNLMEVIAGAPTVIEAEEGE